MKINLRLKKHFSENSTYDNNENKFDLRNMKTILIQNMTEKIFSEMILFQNK